ncbi:MAG: CopG family transcriptional regulator [Myxococcales bacterium]|nr:CopG family transcriptional regulator [Myxococcales bacterium]
MACNVIAIDEDDDLWLAEMAQKEGIPKTHLIRRAVRQYREQFDGDSVSLEALLLSTPALWVDPQPGEPEV